MYINFNVLFYLHSYEKTIAASLDVTEIESPISSESIEDPLTIAETKSSSTNLWDKKHSCVFCSDVTFQETSGIPEMKMKHEKVQEMTKITKKFKKLRREKKCESGKIRRHKQLPRE